MPFLLTLFMGALLVLSLAAGCAHMSWQKAGMEPAAANLDLDDCRREARLKASRFAMQGNSALPQVVADPLRPGVAVNMPSTLPTRDAVVEQDLAAQCMRRKGYDLVRVH